MKQEPWPRAIAVLKEGAMNTAQDQWVKERLSRITLSLQEANSLEIFGQRLLAGMLPELGGGVAGFYECDVKSRSLKRLAAYGLAGGQSETQSVGWGRGFDWPVCPGAQNA